MDQDQLAIAPVLVMVQDQVLALVPALVQTMAQTMVLVTEQAQILTQIQAQAQYHLLLLRPQLLLALTKELPQ